MFFNDIFEIDFFIEYLREKKRLLESSVHQYQTRIEAFLRENPNLEEIDDYNKYIIEHAIKKRNVNLYSVFKAFIEYYIKDAGKRASMIDALIQPEIPTTIKQERKYLEEHEIINVINNLKYHKHKVIALIQDLTGVRSGDVFSIKRGDIIPEIYDGKNVLKIIITGKGNKRNVIYIHDEMIQTLIVDYIIKNINDTGTYFLTRARITKNDTIYNQNRKLYYVNYRRYLRDLKAAMYKVGINSKDFATHDYRRCYARRVWTRYKDINVLQELLNHANPATTMRYLKQSGMKNIDYHKEMQLS
jgi:integrase